VTVDARTLAPIEVVNACLKAHRTTDWDRLRELFHPEARIGVFAGGGEPGDPGQAIADMQRVHQDVVYQASVSTIRELDEQAVLLRGRVRYVTDSGGISDVERYWLYVIREGRLYRSAVFKTAEAALHAYAEHGPTLGA
jgi:hypothetical protein